ncbi:hypothetical protein ACFOWE_31050 [Planomonospora corallina]|uniref:Response regulatory domain-containing protein n=1 Tax=Planomonospora corallina TaxID=1806052 RepID=A0ABV8IIF9_9ACTN
MGPSPDRARRRRLLTEVGYRVRVVADHPCALEAAWRLCPDPVVLDW